MDPLLFALMMFLGFIATEGFVEYAFGVIFDKLEKLKPYRWLLQYASLAVGVFLAFYYTLDMVMTLFGQPQTPVGIFITGVVISRGANFVSDVWSKFVGK